jgi:hypothetical protein
MKGIVHLILSRLRLDSSMINLRIIKQKKCPLMNDSN